MPGPATTGLNTQHTRTAIAGEDERGRRVNATITRGDEDEEEPPTSLIERRAKEAQRQAKLANAVNNHEVQVGMTKAQVIESWGKPTSVDIEVTPRGRRDVLYYQGRNGHTYVYFTDGIVSDFRYGN